MDTVILDEPGAFRFLQTSEPVAGPGEALVQVHRVGVCGTDLHAFAGKQNFFEYPRILGHELGVEVLELPEGDHGLSVGDLCSVEPFLTDLDRETKGHAKIPTNCCPTLQVLGVHVDGGMRERFAVPTRYLHPSSKLSADQLALVEPLSISDHAVLRANVAPGDMVLVVGAGPIGIAAVQFAKAAGGEVTVLELSPDRREFVANAFGVAVTGEATGERYNVVLDATGNVHAMQASFDAVDFAGRLVFIGHTKGPIQFDNPTFHSREMTVMASRNSAGRFPEIIQMIEDGKIDTNPWITHRMGLAEVPERFPSLEGTAGLLKAVVEV